MPAPDYASEITALEAAVASGELTVEQNGERVTYRDMPSLMSALAYFQGKAANAAAPATAQGRFGFSAPAFDRG